jgi:hypothetical protein
MREQIIQDRNSWPCDATEQMRDTFKETHHLVWIFLI